MISIGWDIGGVNLKVARIGADRSVVVRHEPLAIATEGDHLASAVGRLAAPLGGGETVHGITMTGALSQRFVTKAEAVAFILASLEEALPGASLQVLTTGGHFVTPAHARRHPHGCRSHRHHGAMAGEDDMTAIAHAIRTVRSRDPDLDTAQVLGLGEAIAERAERIAGLEAVRLSDRWGKAASEAAPAVAVAHLVGDHATAGSCASR
jgi:uncharacterized hydantoinase/oxoprolinase family protein